MNADGVSQSANGVSIATARYLKERRLAVEANPSKTNLADLKVSLTVHLYPMCFTIDSSVIAYPYDEPYIQFIRALDSRRLTPDVLDILKDCIFYEGCVAVEINDLRNAAPHNYRILLRPHFDVVVREAASSITSDFDLLQVEKHMLLAASKPLCLTPDPTVFFVSSFLNFCERRLDIRSRDLPKLLNSGASVNKSNKFSLQSFLLHRNGGRKVLSAGSGQGLPVFGVPPVAVEPVVQPQILPNLTDSINGKRSPVNFDAFYNREVSFDRPPARKVFFAIRISQQKFLPRIYHGVLRVGTGPDTGQNGQKTVFVLGSKDRAALFLEQLFLTFQREGYVRNIVAPQQQSLQQQMAAQQQQMMQAGYLQQSAAPIVSSAPIVTPQQRMPSTPSGLNSSSGSVPVPPTTIRAQSSSGLPFSSSGAAAAAKQQQQQQQQSQQQQQLSFQSQQSLRRK